MKNIQSWTATSLKREESTGRFSPSLRSVYPGSLHMAEIQFKVYESLFLKYCNGKLLDCGCGRVPYFELLKDQVESHYCIDWSENPEVENLLDEKVNLNQSFRLNIHDFDSVLVSDVIAHIENPGQLIKSLSQHLKTGGHLVLTTPFVYWISEYPHEYFHPTEFALRKMISQAGLELVSIEPYGGYADVLLDTLNKGMTSRISNRLFRLLAFVVKKTSWYKKNNEKTKYSYPIGYTLVAKKI